MTQVRTSPVTGEGSDYGQGTTLGPDVRNPR